VQLKYFFSHLPMFVEFSATTFFFDWITINCSNDLRWRLRDVVEPAEKKVKLRKGKSPEKLAAQSELQASLDAPVEFNGIKQISELSVFSQR
jgi:hypothetical protein